MSKALEELLEGTAQKSWDFLLEINKVINQPGITWKVRRGILREKFKLKEDVVKALVPEPPEGMEFHPSDY